MNNEQFQEIYDYIAQRKVVVDDILQTIVRRSATNLGAEMRTTETGLIFSNGIDGLTPGVEGENWRPYTSSELKSMEKKSPTFGAIAQLHQWGLLGWIRYDDEGSAMDQYSVDVKLAMVLIPGVIREVPQENANSKYLLLTSGYVELTEMEKALQSDTDANLSRYDRLKQNVGKRDLTTNQDLIDVDNIVKRLYDPRR